MEIIIISLFFLAYIIYNEIHKKIIKKSSKEIYIPRDFYENLKETIRYIDYTLESIKQKHENINKIYLKIQNVKTEIEEIEKNQTKKSKRKTKKQKQENESITSRELKEKDKKTEQVPEKSSENQMWEELIQETTKDKIEFSFDQKFDQKKEQISNNKNIEVPENRGVLTKLGQTFRKILGVPEIPVSENHKNKRVAIQQKDFQFHQEISKKWIPLEEYEKQIKNQDVLQSEEKFSTIETEKPLLKQPKNSLAYKQDQEEARQIVLKEAKKLFSELQSKEEIIRFVSKLVQIGFSEKEIHYITNMSLAEISLITKLNIKKVNT